MTPREFAIDVVRSLRGAGFEALWAGGCVRDELMGRSPKDYDVATNATPETVRKVFGSRRTLSIGAAFGVIAVMGPQGARTVEVATFRSDGRYSDGRRPDQVTYGTAEEDARRRDFTINGIFFDPLANQIIDYVGGIDDLKRGIIRAIGDPQQRINEDKLRMLRAVRFTARFEFQLDADCLTAVQQHAHEIVVVSAERISAELRLMLEHSSRAKAAELLVESRLLSVLLPEGIDAYGWGSSSNERGHQAWRESCKILGTLDECDRVVPAWTAFLRSVWPAAGDSIGERWRLSNDEVTGIRHLIRHEPLVLSALQRPWPEVQRVLIAPRVDDLLRYCKAVSIVTDRGEADVAFCCEKLALPADELNPAPLLTGDDLAAEGEPPGPRYRLLLTAARDAQLEGHLRTREEALVWARQQRKAES